MTYKVKLNVFEGPFDLLVYLIENAKMNIYDIKVSEITSQYVKYIDEMQQMDVSISSEFMVLAAELIDIKSKMLLPKINTDGEEVLDEDPRSDLVERLLEYKRFKNISEMLEQGEKENIYIYEKPQEDISKYTDEPDEHLSLEINQFVAAFNAFLLKKKKIEEIKERYEKIERQKISAEARVDFIKKIFQLDRKKTVLFDELVPDKKDNYDIALSFSSVLEMLKQKRLVAEQKVTFGDISISATENLDMEEEQNDR